MRLAEKARQVCGQRVGETFPLRRRRRGIQSVEIAVEAWLTAGAQPPREAAVDQIFLAAGERDPGAGIDHPLDALDVAGGGVKLAMGRSEERRVGEECVCSGSSRWSPYHKKKKIK